MTARLNAVQWQCDWCGAVSEEVPLAPSGIIVESRLPEGWTSVGYGTIESIERGIKLADPFGSRISTLCPACCERPTRELLKYLATMPEPEKASGGSPA